MFEGRGERGSSIIEGVIEEIIGERTEALDLGLPVQPLTAVRTFFSILSTFPYLLARPNGMLRAQKGTDGRDVVYRMIPIDSSNHDPIIYHVDHSGNPRDYPSPLRIDSPIIRSVISSGDLPILHTPQVIV
jgi:hypothetical protein